MLTGLCVRPNSESFMLTSSVGRSWLSNDAGFSPGAEAGADVATWFMTLVLKCIRQNVFCKNVLLLSHVCEGI